MTHMVNAKQVSEILGLNVFTVYKLARERILPSVKISKKLVRFDPGDIEKYIAKQKGLSR